MPDIWDQAAAAPPPDIWDQAALHQDAPSAAPKAPGWLSPAVSAMAPLVSQAPHFAQGVGDVIGGLYDLAKAALPHPDLTGQTAREAHELIDKGDYLGAAKHLVSGAIESAPGGKLITSAIHDTIDEGSKALSAMRAGNAMGASEHAARAVPVLGPAIGAGLDTAMGSPETATSPAVEADPSRALGQVVTGALASEIAPEIPGVAKRAVGKIKNLNQASVPVAVTRALRPTPSSPDFPTGANPLGGNLTETLADIKAVNPGFKPAVDAEGNFNLVDAADKAVRAHQEQLGPWFQRVEGKEISGAPIVAATRDAINGMLPSEQEAAQGLVARAEQDYRTFTPRELKARLELLNERLSAFYDASPSKQSSALADIPRAVVKAQRDAAADLLYNSLDPEGLGAGPREIQARTGNIINIRDAAARRANAIVAEQGVTPGERLAQKIGGPLKTARKIAGGGANAGMAFTEGSEGRSIPLLQKAFNAVPDDLARNRLGTIPKPQPGTMLPPATDTSGPLPVGVADFRSVGAQNPRAPRALLGGATPGQKEPLITPPPEDTSGPIPNAPPNVRGYPAGVSTRQLPAPKSVPQGGFAINDLVPYKNPSTGQIEYVPAWMLQEPPELTSPENQ